MMYIVNADVADAMDELDKIAPGMTHYWFEEKPALPDPNKWCNYNPIYKILIPSFSVIALGIIVFGIALVASL